MQVTAYKNLFGFTVRPVFLVIDLTGLLLLTISRWLPDLWQVAFATTGSTLLTIGITLPVALYYQARTSAEAFKILNTCTQVGIDSIFSSRKRDSSDLRSAIDYTASTTTEISLLGIAFRSFFDPSAESTPETRERLNDPSVTLHVLLLDPDSEAANKRAVVELGNATQSDIKHTLNNSLVASVQERLKHYIRRKPEFADDLKKIIESNEDNYGEIESLRSALQLEVRTYDTEPVVFIMRFDSSLFTEQYHRGRPDEIVPIGSCIGKYMPVTQFRSGSTGYRFLDCHFLNIWKESKDRTDDIIKQAIKTFPIDLER